MAKIVITNKGGGDFEPAPEGNGKAVCVDVTPIKVVQTQWGEKEKFRFVFELDPASFGTKKDGSRFCVWSAGLVPSSHKKSALTDFLKTWMGPKFPQNLETFDVESLLGQPAFIVVLHSQKEDDPKVIYANIKHCGPDNNGAPLAPSGTFVREEDRPKKDAPAGGASQFRAAEKPEGAGRLDWQKCKVHVGKHKGLDLGSLEMEDVEALLTKWLPIAKAKPKPLADDKRLIDALEAAQAAIKEAQEAVAPASAPEPDPEADLGY
jgi:hypothetical protein